MATVLTNGGLAPTVCIGWRELYELAIAPAREFEAALAMATPLVKDYREAARFDQRYRMATAGIRAPEYKAIADAFRASIERLEFMNALPLEIHFNARVAMECFCVARVQMGFAPDDESRDHNPECQRLALEAYRRKKEKLPIAIKEARLREGSLLIESLIEKGAEQEQDYITDGVYAVFSAMLSAAYQAFETMASDLWVAALNKHDALAKDFMSTAESKSLSFSAIIGNDLNLRGRMGTILAQNNKVDFQTLYNIKDAFVAAFGSAIDPVFGDTDELSKTEKIRHLIAHRGGVVDARFISQMSKFSEFANLAALERLPLSGSMVRDRINICVVSGVRLLRIVDEWHP